MIAQQKSRKQSVEFKICNLIGFKGMKARTRLNFSAGTENSNFPNVNYKPFKYRHNVLSPGLLCFLDRYVTILVAKGS